MILFVYCALSCATLSKSTTDDATTQNTESVSDEMSGALVTSDCMYEGYAYAIDILLSCGDERFGAELRLHTFKKHAWEHQKIFRDQRLTYRSQYLWFDDYQTPRCVSIDDNRWFLSTAESDCTQMELVTGEEGDFRIQDTSSGLCAGLGGAVCDEHEWTGGRECGGIDHRYLPLVMGDCASGLRFQFQTEADSCAGEYPEEQCF